MYQIDQEEPTVTFQQAWRFAGMHLGRASQGSIRWIKADLRRPMIEHLSFLVGNQLVFVHVLCHLHNFGKREALLNLAHEAGGIPCLMPMVEKGAGFVPEHTGWGLIHAETGEPVDPLALVDDKKIDMSDWEIHDFAVEMVARNLVEDGFVIDGRQNNARVFPSIWCYKGDDKRWVVVKGFRPNETEDYDNFFPTDLDDFIHLPRDASIRGFLAKVQFANSDDPLDNNGNPTLPVYRGHGANIRFEGLIPIPENQEDATC